MYVCHEEWVTRRVMGEGGKRGSNDGIVDGFGAKDDGTRGDITSRVRDGSLFVAVSTPPMSRIRTQVDPTGCYSGSRSRTRPGFQTVGGL
jgi:hypothetical protein